MFIIYGNYYIDRRAHYRKVRGELYIIFYFLCINIRLMHKYVI